jgi:hypothetical protein
LARRRSYYPALGVGAAVLTAGSGVMAALWLTGVTPPGLKGWGDFKATTIGETLLLPVLVTSLLVAFRYAPQAPRRERQILAVGALVGLASGVGLQLSWLLDNSPHLTWALPRAHHFSVAGWYHAGFLCAASTLLVSLALGTTYRVHQAAPGTTSYMTRSPILVMMLTSMWTFSTLVIRDRADDISSLATVASVSLTAVGAIFLCAYAFHSWTACLSAFTWSFCLTALLTLLIIAWPKTLLAILGAVIAVGLTTGIHFRDTVWRARTVEYALTSAAALCLVVLPLSDPRLVLRNIALVLCLIPVVLAITRFGPLVRRDAINASSPYDAGIIAFFGCSMPIADWLLGGGEASAAAGSFIVTIAAALFGQLLVPGYKADMSMLMEQESARAGVTSHPELSALAARVAVRGAAWGTAAIGGLLAIVVSAGPSMGFADGQDLPDMKSWLVMIALLVALAIAVISMVARRSSWIPCLVVIGDLAVCALNLSFFITRWMHHRWWWFWVVAAAIVVGLWHVESIAANAAMRPRWLVRRSWRQAIAVSTASAIGSIFLVICTDGLIDGVGHRSVATASLGVFAIGGLAGLLIVAGAGWALDWQPTLIASGHAIAAGPNADAPNWARYRVRSSLFQDFLLIQGLTVIGIWYPALSLEHIGLSSEQSRFSVAAMAVTGILFFGPLLIWTMQNSVKHVEEQSRKARRRSNSYFFGTIPAVTLGEECSIVRRMLHSTDGPVTQRQWARAIAVHQLHLNVIGYALTIISLVGSIGILGGITLAKRTGPIPNGRPTWQ